MTKLTPRTATTTADVCALPRDNWHEGRFAMHVDETTVSLMEVGNVTLVIPRRVFDRLVDIYNGHTPEASHAD